MTATSAPSRIPPLGEDLVFAQNTTTGTVHIEVWVDPEPEPLPHAEAGKDFDYVAMFMAPPPPTLCGQRDRNWYEQTCVPVTAFADDDLCMACVRALGDQSARAFDHPCPEDEDPDD